MNTLESTSIKKQNKYLPEYLNYNIWDLSDYIEIFDYLNKEVRLEYYLERDGSLIIKSHVVDFNYFIKIDSIRKIKLVYCSDDKYSIVFDRNFCQRHGKETHNIGARTHKFVKKIEIGKNK